MPVTLWKEDVGAVLGSSLRPWGEVEKSKIEGIRKGLKLEGI
jgi:hypothetical protein